MTNARKMKIAHVVAAPATGGAETYVRELAVEMKGDGHQVMVIFLWHAVEIGGTDEVERAFLARLTHAGVEYGFVDRGSGRFSLAKLGSFRKLVRRFGPDVLHVHLYSAAVLCPFIGAPVVYTRHGIDLRVPRSFYTFFLDRVVQAYVGICQACTRVLEGATRARPVVRIDNGARRIDVPHAGTPQRRPDNVLTFLAVGRLNSYKNYPLLLNAVARLPSGTEWRLWIAGDGEEGPSLIARTRELGLEDRVTFLGNVPDVGRLFSQVDIFVMSSKSEGLPIALIEATLAGLPVVVTNVGGCAEVVHTVVNGIVADELTTTSLSAALARMTGDPELREFFARNARKYGSAYALRPAVEKHLSLYERLVDTPTRNKGVDKHRGNM
jgi:glycosyltransferase involved in cell wall biosynthesis